MNQKPFFNDQGLRNARLGSVSRLAGGPAQSRPDGGTVEFERRLNPWQATLNQVAIHGD